MSLFYLGSILVYISFKRKIWLYFVSPALFVLAVLTKETAVTLPFALLLWKRNFKKQVVHWILLFFIVFAAIIHPNYGELLAYSFKTRSIWENLLSQVNGVTYLLSRLIVVWGLNIDPDFQSVSAPLFVVKLTLLLSFVFIGLIKRKHWFGFGILWFFLHLVPTNSIVPRLDIANERQLYLGIWGIFLILGIGAERLLKPKIFWTVAITISIIFGYATIARNEVYKSEITLWEDTVSKSPGKPRAYNNLGYAYAMNRRYNEAEKAYSKALELKPDYGIAKNNLIMLKQRR